MTVHELRLVDEDHALSESIYLVFEYDQTTGQWTTLTAHELQRLGRLRAPI